MMNAHKAMGTHAICCISLHGDLKMINTSDSPLPAATPRNSIPHGAGYMFQIWLTPRDKRLELSDLNLVVLNLIRSALV